MLKIPRAMILLVLLSLPGSPLWSNPLIANNTVRSNPLTTVPPPILRSWLPASKPKAIIIALHSFGDYSAAFNQLGPWFVEQGMALYSWDQRGFGANINAGKWPGQESLESDLVTRVEEIAKRHNAPLFILGESLGGAVAINVAARNPQLPIDGLILVAPAVREGIPARYGWNLAIAAAALVRPGYLLNVERDEDDPRFSPQAAQRLANDPLVQRNVRMDHYQGLIRYADRTSNIADTLNTPTLLLYGGDDNSVPAISIERLRKHLGAIGTYHFYPSGPHLLLQGAQWHQVANDISQWISTRLHADIRAPAASHTDSAELLSQPAH
jgi:alpha-beta hydrolase superfamily lysophospholipase